MHHFQVKTLRGILFSFSEKVHGTKLHLIEEYSKCEASIKAESPAKFAGLSNSINTTVKIQLFFEFNTTVLNTS